MKDFLRLKRVLHTAKEILGRRQKYRRELASRGLTRIRIDKSELAKGIGLHFLDSTPILVGGKPVGVIINEMPEYYSAALWNKAVYIDFYSDDDTPCAIELITDEVCMKH